MKKISIFLLSCFVATAVQATNPPERSTGYPYTQVPFTQVKVAPSSFWGQRLAAARSVTVPLAFSKCESEHRYRNFSMAAYTLQHPGHKGLQTKEWNVGTFMGFPFDDTDVYKTIEGASYLLQTYPDTRLKNYIDSVLTVVGAAQEPDGYLYTARTINPEHPHPWSGQHRWEKEEVLSHELYNLGHMVDAACAHYQATGSTKFLDIARRYADCVVREVGSKEGQATVVPGHQIAEMALCRLYLVTGEKKYLDEAKYMLDYRGKTKIHDIYSQSDKPITKQKEAWGHAVRAGYMYAGIADVAALTQDSDYIRTIDAIWNNIVSKKYYITGGVGARHAGEAFGADYELPNMTAYNETCAAISMVYLFQRMFLLHGDAKYIDCLERTLYNGVIDGMSVDGGRFFYPNPLASDGKYRFNSDNTLTRQPWFGCACCPSNLCRFIPSLPGYIYAVKDNSLYVNLFAANTTKLKVGGKDVVVSQTTDYPWNGDVKIKIEKNNDPNLALHIRIPGWTRGEVVPSDLYTFVGDTVDDSTRWTATTSNGKILSHSALDKGYLVVDKKAIGRKLKAGDEITVHFDMTPQMVKANDRVSADRGRVAFERGPLVYCAESADNTGYDVLHTVVAAASCTDKNSENCQKGSATDHCTSCPTPTAEVVADYEIHNTEADGSTFTVTALKVPAQTLKEDHGGTIAIAPVTLTLIPYYAWNHRGATRMNIWFPQGLRMMEE